MANKRRSDLLQAAERRKSRLIDIARELVRIPSENTPPTGAEFACQNWLASQLRALDLAVDVYEPADVSGFTEHALCRCERNLRNRPNVAARMAGANGGRSLLLSGHVDTVPRGTQDWTRDPFAGEIEGSRLFGRGSNDMKAGIAMNLFVVETLRDLGIRLNGDLIFESVVDEEFAGCSGTLAGRLRGYRADAAIVTEPSNLRICPAQRGGRTAHITLRAPRQGVLDTAGGFPQGAIPQLTCLLQRVTEFAEARRSACSVHPMYAANADPVPVSVTKVHTSPWGMKEPLTVPETAQVEIYWQLMPGETQASADEQFFAWLDGVVNAAPKLFASKPEVTFPIPFLPGSAIPASEELVTGLASCAETVLAKKPEICGIEGPCDLFIFHQFGIPAVLWGACGANIHAADEYVDLDSLFSAASVLLLFAAQWCGIED